MPFSARSLFSVILFAVFTLHAEIKLPTPLIRAHAHNDYVHKKPLTEALSHGFCSVEVDVHLVNGQLLAAHDLKDVQSERTLEKLYLNPLRELAQKNGGRIFPNGPDVTLLIDIKVDPEKTKKDPKIAAQEASKAYAVLSETLKKYTNILSRFYTDRIETNAVTIILTGSRPSSLVFKETERYAGCDGKLSDLDSRLSKEFFPLISDSWEKNFTWKGTGTIPLNEREKLRAYVAKAHEKGRRIRFWKAPETVAFWNELFAAGVDLINADDLAGLEKFLRSK